MKKFGSLSRHLFLGFIAEIAVLTWILVTWAQLSFLVAIILAVLAPVFIRIVIVFISFLVALVFSQSQLRSMNWRSYMGTICAEILATIKLFFYYHPLQPIICQHQPESIKTGQTPVLLVHGFFSNAGFWKSIRDSFTDSGITNVFSINLEPTFGDIDEYARQLASRIEEVCKNCVVDQLIIIAHSMGGIVARNTAVNCPEHISQIICLGSPHHGTVLAALVPAINTRQMRRNNRWLQSLNRVKASIPIVNLYSPLDNIVIPADSSKLESTNNQLIEPIGHLDMAFHIPLHRRLCELVLDQKSVNST